MSIYHAGSPLCMFAHLQLSLCSRPKIDKLDEIHETFNCLHSCFSLLRCKFSENKYIIEVCIQSRFLLSNSTFVEIRMKTKPNNEALVRCQKATSLSRVRAVTQSQSQSSYTEKTAQTPNFNEAYFASREVRDS